jgi:hypothetical protein
MFLEMKYVVRSSGMFVVYDTQVTAENIRTVYFIGTKNTRRTLIGTLVVGKQRLGCRGPGVMNYGDGASMVTGCRRETRSAIPRA